MKTIKLSDKELEFLSTLYDDEIRQTENYIRQLRQILSKLGKNLEPGNNEIIAEPKKRGRKPGKKSGG